MEISIENIGAIMTHVIEMGFRWSLGNYFSNSGAIRQPIHD